MDVNLQGRIHAGEGAMGHLPPPPDPKMKSLNELTPPVDFSAESN